MSSPLNNPQVEQWFQRLNAPLKRLPAQERAELHQEVRQHLDALAKANEELGSSPSEAAKLALTQFGDPGKFGKQMAQEWQQQKASFRADMAAVFVCFGLHALAFVGSLLVGSLAVLWINHYGHPSILPAITNAISLYGWSFALSVLMGRMFPFRALKGIFYERVCFFLWWWIYIGVHFLQQPKLLPSTESMFIHGLLWTPTWLAIGLGVAYLASVTKRGWYRPTIEDFKLTLPKRRKLAE